MANGQISIQGQQTGVASGSPYIGPFTCPCSDSEQTVNVPLGGGGYSISPNYGVSNGPPNGLLLIPNNVSGTGIVLKGSSDSDVGIAISGLSPTLINFDPTRVPEVIYIYSDDTTTGTLTARFF